MKLSQLSPSSKSSSLYSLLILQPRFVSLSLRIEALQVEDIGLEEVSLHLVELEGADGFDVAALQLLLEDLGHTDLREVGAHAEEVAVDEVGVHVVLHFCGESGCVLFGSGVLFRLRWDEVSIGMAHCDYYNILLYLINSLQNQLSFTLMDQQPNNNQYPGYPPYQQTPDQNQQQPWQQGYYQDPSQPQQFWNPPAQTQLLAPVSSSQINGNQEMAYDDAIEEDDYMEGDEEEEEEEDDNIDDLDLSQLVQQTSSLIPSTSMKISIPVMRVAQPQIVPRLFNHQNVPEMQERQEESLMPPPLHESKQVYQQTELVTESAPLEHKQTPSFKISIPQTHTYHPPPQQQKSITPIAENLQQTPMVQAETPIQPRIDQEHIQPMPSPSIPLLPVLALPSQQSQPVKIVLSGLLLGAPKNIAPVQTHLKPKPQQYPQESFPIPALPQENFIEGPPISYPIEQHLEQVKPSAQQTDQSFTQPQAPLIAELIRDDFASAPQEIPSSQQAFMNAVQVLPVENIEKPFIEQHSEQANPVFVPNPHTVDFSHPPIVEVQKLHQLVEHQMVIEQAPQPENVLMDEDHQPPQKQKKKGPKEKKRKKIKGSGDLLQFYDVKKVKVTMEFSPVDCRARCQSIYKLVLKPEEIIQGELQQLQSQEIYKKFYLDVKFHSKQQVISKVCLLKKGESGELVQDELPFLYDLTGQGAHQEKRFEKVGRRLYSYELAQSQEYDRQQADPALNVPKVVTINFKKESLAEQLPKSLDIMISSIIQSIENFGIRAIKYKIFDQMPGAGLSAQEGTYFLSSDMYDSQMLWLPIIKNHQMVPLNWSFKYIVPKDFSVIASGHLYIKNVEEQGGDQARALFHYKLKDHEIAPASKIGFILGKFGEIYKMQDVRSIPNAYGFFINTDKQQLFAGNNHFMERSVVDTVLYQLQTRIIAQPYPFTALKLVFVPNLFLKNQRKQSVNFIGGVHILDEELLYPKNVAEGRHRTFKAIASAIAFDYFGGKVYEETPEDFWLLQGIRESIGNQFKIMKSGILLYRYHIMQTLESVYKKAKNGIERYPLKSPYLPHPAENMLNELIYEKCELIMHMIESMIDKSYFERIIRELYAQGSMQISTSLFQKIFKSVVGFKLKQFAKNWISSTSCPLLSVSYTFNKKNNSLDLTLTQESAVKEHFSLIKYMKEAAGLDELLVRPFLKKDRYYNSNESELVKVQLQNIDKMGEFNVDWRQCAVRWFEGEVNVMLYLTDGAEITPQQQKMMLKNKETSVSINIPLNVKVKKTIQNKKKEYESMHMQEHEEDEDEVDASIDQGGRQSAVIDNNQWKFGMNDFELEDYPQETKNIFDVKNLESSVLWIRVDPDMEYIRKVSVKQDVNNWLFQLLLEKDIIGQIEAIRQLYKQNQKQQFIFYILQAVCTNESYFVKVRKVALKYLQKMQTSIFNEYLSHEKILIKIFNQRNYDANIGFYKSNDFSRLLEYYFDKYLLKTIAKCKEQPLYVKPAIVEMVREHTKSLAPPPPAIAGEPGSITIPIAETVVVVSKKIEKTPKEHLLKVSSDQIAHLLLKILQENDNSENSFDDSNYLKQIIKSLGSLDNFKYMPDIAKEILRQFKLDHIGRFSPQFAVTKGAISAYFNIHKQIYIFNSMKRPLIMEDMVEDLAYIDEQIKLTQDALIPMSAQIDNILTGVEKNWPLDLRFFIAYYRIKHCFLYQQNNFLRALYIQFKVVDQFLSEKKIWDAIEYARQLALFLEKHLSGLDIREALLDNPRSHAILNILWQFLSISMGYVDQSLVFWMKKIWHLLYGIQWPLFIEKVEIQMISEGKREQDTYQLEIDEEWAPLGVAEELSKHGKNGEGALKGSRMIKNCAVKKKGEKDAFEAETSMYGKLQIEKEDKIKIAFPVNKPSEAQHYRTPISFTYPQSHTLSMSGSNKIIIGGGMAQQQPKVSIQIPNYATSQYPNGDHQDDMHQMMQSLNSNQYDENSKDYPMFDESHIEGNSDESIYDEFAALTFPHCLWLQKCWDVTGTLWYHEEAADFLEPLTRKALGKYYDQYMKMIPYAMDLTTIKEKIKSYSYASVAHWQTDVETMFNNCLIFNDDKSEIHKTCLKLRNFYFKRLEETGLVQQQYHQMTIRIK